MLKPLCYSCFMLKLTNFSICNQLFAALKNCANSEVDLTIHSQFQNSINLTLFSKNAPKSANNTPIFCSILCNNKILAPMSLVIDKKSFDFRQIRQVQGFKEPKSFTFYLKAQHTTLVLKINFFSANIEVNAIVYKLNLVDLKFNSQLKNNIAIERIALNLKQYLDNKTDFISLYQSYIQKSDPYTVQVLDNIFKNLEHLTDLIKLLGLGNGLTPSGDDFLLGFISGFDLTSKLLSKKVQEFMQKCLKKVADNLHKTNDISRTMLYWGLLHYYNSSTLETLKLCANIELLDDQTFIANLSNIPSYGHSSFYDYLTGFLFYLKILKQWQLL